MAVNRAHSIGSLCAHCQAKQCWPTQAAQHAQHVVACSKLASRECCHPGTETVSVCCLALQKLHNLCCFLSFKSECPVAECPSVNSYQERGLSTQGSQIACMWEASRCRKTQKSLAKGLAPPCSFCCMACPSDSWPRHSPRATTTSCCEPYLQTALVCLGSVAYVCMTTALLAPPSVIHVPACDWQGTA